MASSDSSRNHRTNSSGGRDNAARLRSVALDSGDGNGGEAAVLGRDNLAHTHTPNTGHNCSASSGGSSRSLQQRSSTGRRLSRGRSTLGEFASSNVSQGEAGEQRRIGKHRTDARCGISRLVRSGGRKRPNPLGNTANWEEPVLSRSTRISYLASHRQLLACTIGAVWTNIPAKFLRMPSSPNH